MRTIKVSGCNSCRFKQYQWSGVGFSVSCQLNESLDFREVPTLETFVETSTLCPITNGLAFVLDRRVDLFDFVGAQLES